MPAGNSVSELAYARISRHKESERGQKNPGVFSSYHKGEEERKVQFSSSSSFSLNGSISSFLLICFLPHKQGEVGEMDQ